MEDGGLVLRGQDGRNRLFTLNFKDKEKDVTLHHEMLWSVILIIF